MPESGRDYSIANDFGNVKLDIIEIEYQALELATSTNDTITKLKYRGFYTRIFNSNDKSAQYFPARESNQHRRSSPLDWKLIISNILGSLKQVISCILNIILTLSLKNIYSNIKSLV